MIYTQPVSPQLIRSHPQARGLRGCWLFGYKPANVIDHAFNIKLTAGSGSITELRSRLTGKTLWFDTTDWLEGSDIALPSGTGPWTIIWRGFPNQSTLGTIWNYGTSGTIGAYNGLRFNGANVEFLGWGADVSAAHGLGATQFRRVLFAVTYDSTNIKIFIKIESNPLAQIGVTTARTLNLVKHATAGIQIGINQNDGVRFGGYYDLLYIYNRAIDTPELNRIALDPYQIFRDLALPSAYTIGNLVAAPADDLAQPWTDALSIGYGVTGLAATDSMALSDALSYRASLFIADSLNSWADALTYDYLAPSTPLSVFVVDKFIRGGTVEGNNLSLRDGFAYVRGPSGPVYISISDLGAFLNDSNLKIGYGIRVAD